MSFDPDSQESKLLFDRAKSGSSAFAQELLKQQTNDMYYLARAYLSDSEDAKMAVRMAFQKAFKRLHTVNDIHDLQPWLANMVRLAAVDMVIPLETETASARYTRVDERPATNVRFPDRTVCQKQFLQVLNGLTDAERAAAAARYYDHMEVEDAASLLRIKVSDVEALLVNAKNKLSANHVDMSEFTALADFINPSEGISSAAAAASATETLTQKPTDFKAKPVESVQTAETEETDDGNEATRELGTIHPAETPKAKPKKEKKRRVEDEDEDEDEDDDGIDYDDDEGYDDYDYDRHGNRKRHKSHIVLKIILTIVIILAVIAALLFGIYKVDEDLFYTIPGTTRLVTLIENITGQDISGPYDTEATATATAEATATATADTATDTAATTGLTAGTETGLDTVIGTVQIQLDAVNIRSSHDASSDLVGTVYQGENYDVYGVYVADDFTWYRIGEDMWVADDGTYLTYTAY